MSSAVLTSVRHDVASDPAYFQAFATEAGWGDGLPLVPPTEGRVARFLELVVLRVVGAMCEQRMAPAVVGDDVTVLEFGLHEVRIRLGHATDVEERGLHVRFAEDVEQLGRRPRVGTVVECERDGFRSGRRLRLHR